jgi:hypothetical protein
MEELKISQKVLEVTSQKLTYLLDYADGIQIFYLCVGIFTSIIVYGGLYCFYFFEREPTTFFSGVTGLAVILIALIPPLVLLGLMQLIGFSEVWVFDRKSRKFSIKRRLALGEQQMTYSSQAIESVMLYESTDQETNPSERYQISLVSSHLSVGGAGQRNIRVLYSSPDRESAEKMAALFRRYLGLSANP